MSDTASDLMTEAATKIASSDNAPMAGIDPGDVSILNRRSMDKEGLKKAILGSLPTE